MVNQTPKIADGMPMFGQTTYERVSRLLATDRAELLERCPGAVDISIERGAGQVWRGVNGGPYEVVHTDDDYLLLMTLDSTAGIPTIPPRYKGVPVHFRVST